MPGQDGESLKADPRADPYSCAGVPQLGDSTRPEVVAALGQN